MNCVKEKIKQVADAVAKPTIKNQMSVTMGVYKDESSTTPERELNYNSDSNVKLITAIAIIAAAVVLVSLYRKVCKILDL